MLWDEIVYSICVGAFFTGLILSIFLLVMIMSNMGDEGDEIEGQVEIEENLISDLSEVQSIDPDSFSELDVNIATSLDPDISLDIELGNFNLDFAEIVDYSSQTPLILILNFYLLWFGAVGLISYEIIKVKFVWISVTIVISIIITKSFNKLYQKISKNSTYKVRVKNDLLGRLCTVKIPVDTNGGVVTVKSTESTQQIGVKSFFPLSYFYENDIVYICKYKDGMYYVDSNPSNVQLPQLISKKKKKISK